MNKVSDLYLAVPRGFCAGVKRAVAIVEKCLQDYGRPVYVRHEIVHNRHVVADLQKKGVIFIESWEELADTTRPVIISAHGASAQVYDEAKKMGLNLIDATCPLVEKVHRQIRRLSELKKTIIVIGKQGHPEITGTIGQAPTDSNIFLIHSADDVAALPLSAEEDVGVVTQTTLAVDEVEKIMEVLRHKFNGLKDFKRSDVCYATTHRQAAVKAVAKLADAVIVIGSKNSSNSLQLKKTAESAGVQKTWLIDDVSELQLEELNNCRTLGISAGASAPEHLVTEVLTTLKKHYENLKIHDIIVAEERMEFKY